MMVIDEADYRTSESLFETEKVGIRRDVDVLYQKYLRSKDALTDLETQRITLPLSMAQTEAQRDAAQARLAQAEHDWTNTRITCPFRARVDSVQASTAQVVTAFFSIATLTDLEAFEMAVGIDPRELRWLDERIHPNHLGLAVATGGPDVTVRWSLRGEDFRWCGQVSRFEKVDEVTRTARMVVEIPERHMTAISSAVAPQVRPTLAIGMFCRAELPGREMKNAVLIPRSAVYDDRYVYVAEPENPSDSTAGRLVERRVAVLRSIGDNVLVDYEGRDESEPCELRPGDRLVTSQLMKPVVGMRVRIRDVADTRTTARSSRRPILSGVIFGFVLPTSVIASLPATMKPI
jgi:multidrug efflux pump subunit AcrA (membrane-fusion protein)